MEELNVAKPVSDEYEPVTGLDQQTVQCVRACEQEANDKFASDQAHVFWAYGILWSLFAVYGVMLWRRAVRQSVEVRNLQQRLEKLES